MAVVGRAVRLTDEWWWWRAELSDAVLALREWGGELGLVLCPSAALSDPTAGAACVAEQLPPPSRYPQADAEWLPLDTLRKAQVTAKGRGTDRQTDR